MLRPDTFALTATLALMTALGPLSVDMYLASMPEIGRVMAASAAEVQLTISVYLLGFAGGQIVYGPISDRFGRRPVLLIALGLFTAASLACAAAPSIEALIAARFFQALGGSGSIVIARAIVRDLYSGARAGRELSLMGATMALAPIVAPVIGGGMQAAFGWQASFVALVACGLAISAVIWKLLPETVPPHAVTPVSVASILRGYGEFLVDRRFVAYLGIIACSYGGLFAWISGASFVLQTLYGLSPVGFGIAFGISSAGYLVGTLIATSIVMRIGLGRTIGLGTLAQAAGGLAMVVALVFDVNSATAIAAAIALYLTGLGLATPQAMAGALSPYPTRAGAASSLFGFIQQSWSALLGAVVGHLLGSTAWPMVAAVAAMGVLSLIIWALTRDARRRPGPRPAQ